MMIEISDQADPDSMFVPAVVVACTDAAMRAVLLLGPTGTDEDFAIRVADAVANDEVIAEFVPAALFVPGFHSRRRAAIIGRVMHNDVFPATRKSSGRRPAAVGRRCWRRTRLRWRWSF